MCIRIISECHACSNDLYMLMDKIEPPENRERPAIALMRSSG